MRYGLFREKQFDFLGRMKLQFFCCGVDGIVEG